MLDDRIEGGAQDSQEGAIRRRAPAAEEQAERLDLGQLRGLAEAAVLDVSPPNQPRHDLVDQARRSTRRWRRAPARTPAGSEVPDRGFQESEELGGREKGATADELAVRSQECGGGQPAQVIAAIDIGAGIAVHA